MSAIPAIPTGIVTFLFTDMEGSTKLWEADPDGMVKLLARHDALMRRAIGAFGGTVFKTVGDAFCAAFPTAPAALASAVAGQIALSCEPWPEETPVRVRIALHSGVTQERDGDYFGPVLNRVSRLLSAGHGGQILVSNATSELGREHLAQGATLRDLGIRRLKDLTHPERVFQLVHPALPDKFPPLNTLDAVPNNLPQQVTRFIGREKEMQTSRALLGKTHLLTLVGTGGTGKTRLALQLVADVLDEYPDGAWLVELAPLSDASLVPQTVASVLGVQEQAGQTMTQVLAERLKGKKLLLLLDNCEHLLAACAQLIATLLRACPDVRITATSREPLGIAGEQSYRVPSLSLPTPVAARCAKPNNLLRFESVCLFVDRAQTVMPEWVVTDANALVLARICSRLDGIPLAVELAAARVRSLSLEQIDERLDHRFRLLTGGDRAALPRQQTLQALVDWSYDLLNDREKTLLMRLSVFAGGWNLEAAEAVCCGETSSPCFDPISDWEVLDLLTSLVDKSLVLAEEDGGQTRYRMLDTLKQYGAAKRESSGQGNQMRYRHLSYFVAFAEKAEQKLGGPEQVAWLNRLETEHDNLRAALACRAPVPNDSISDREWLVLRLAGALWRFWDVRGYLGEGREQIARALELTSGWKQNLALSDQRARAKALYGAGVLAMSQADFAESRDRLCEALSVFRESDDKHGVAGVLLGLGTNAINQGDFAAALLLFEESLDLWRALGDKRGIVSSLNNLGIVALTQGDFVSARFFFEECCTLYRELGGKSGIAGSHLNLSCVFSEQGEFAAARSLLEESLVVYREMNDKNGIANALNSLGIVMCEQNDPSAWPVFKESLAVYCELGNQVGLVKVLEGMAWMFQNTAKSQPYIAVVVWGACHTFRGKINLPLPLSEQKKYRQNLDTAQLALCEEGYLAAWAEGCALSIEQAMEVASCHQPCSATITAFPESKKSRKTATPIVRSNRARVWRVSSGGVAASPLE